MKKLVLSVSLLFVVLFAAMAFVSCSAESEVYYSNVVKVSGVELRPQKSLSIWSNAKSVMEVGEIVTLSSKLTGFEDCTDIRYQWQRSHGGAWEDIPGATGSSYSFAASIESLEYDYSLLVYYSYD